MVIPTLYMVLAFFRGGEFFPRWRRGECACGSAFPRNRCKGRYAPLCTPRTYFFSKKQAKRCDTRVRQKSLLGLNPAFAGFRLRPCGSACDGVLGAWLASEPSMIAHFGAAGAHIRLGGDGIGRAFGLGFLRCALILAPKGRGISASRATVAGDVGAGWVY